MGNVKYVGTNSLTEKEMQDLENVLGLYMPRYERRLKQFLLTVSVKQTHKLGKTGRFTVKFLMDSPEGRSHIEQSGWGLVKTARRAAEHMQNMLSQKIRKETAEKFPREQRRKK